MDTNKLLGMAAITAACLLGTWVMLKASHNESKRRRKKREKDIEDSLRGD